MLDEELKKEIKDFITSQPPFKTILHFCKNCDITLEHFTEVYESLTKNDFDKRIEDYQSPIDWNLPDDWTIIENTPPIPFIWEGLIPENQMGLLIGDGGSFKSLLALYLGCCIATGTKLLGRDVKQGKMVYISHEDNKQVVFERLKWVRQNLALDSKMISKNLKTVWYDDISESFPTPQAFDEFLIDNNIKNETDIRLVVIDTFRQHNATGKENSSEDILPIFLSAKKYLKYGCSVMFLHHVNKKDTYSGHTSLRTNARYMIYIEREKDNDNKCCLWTDKINYGDPNQRLNFKFVFDETSKYRLVSEDEYSNTETQLKVFFDLLVKNNGLVVKQDMMDCLEIKRDSAYKIAWGKLKEKIERDYFKVYVSSKEVTDWDGKKHKVKGKQLYVDKNDYNRYLSKKGGN